MTVERKLAEARQKAYRSMGLNASDANFGSRADHFRRLAQDAGVNAWDLNAKQIADGVIDITFTADNDAFHRISIKPGTSDADASTLIAAYVKRISAPKPTTPNGRSINTQHLASPKALDKAGVEQADVYVSDKVLEVNSCTEDDEIEDRLDRIEFILNRLAAKFL